MDNASSNKAMMRILEPMLVRREVPFNAADRQVMCFSHIIDLCAGCVIRNVEGDDDEISSDDETVNSGTSNCISRARSVVRAIRASGKRRDDFLDAIKTGNDKDYFFTDEQPPKNVELPELELLRDVRTRWDSVFFMLQRLRTLRPV